MRITKIKDCILAGIIFISTFIYANDPSNLVNELFEVTKENLTLGLIDENQYQYIINLLAQEPTCSEVQQLLHQFPQLKTGQQVHYCEKTSNKGSHTSTPIVTQTFSHRFYPKKHENSPFYLKTFLATGDFKAKWRFSGGERKFNQRKIHLSYSENYSLEAGNIETSEIPIFFEGRNIWHKFIPNASLIGLLNPLGQRKNGLKFKFNPTKYSLSFISSLNSGALMDSIVSVFYNAAHLRLAIKNQHIDFFSSHSSFKLESSNNPVHILSGLQYNPQGKLISLQFAHSWNNKEHQSGYFLGAKWNPNYNFRVKAYSTSSKWTNPLASPTSISRDTLHGFLTSFQRSESFIQVSSFSKKLNLGQNIWGKIKTNLTQNWVDKDHYKAYVNATKIIGFFKMENQSDLTQLFTPLKNYFRIKNQTSYHLGLNKITFIGKVIWQEKTHPKMEGMGIQYAFQREGSLRLKIKAQSNQVNKPHKKFDVLLSQHWLKTQGIELYSKISVPLREYSIGDSFQLSFNFKLRT